MKENNIQDLTLGLYWKGKRTAVDKTVLPFQSLEVIETINESRATREAEKGGMFKNDPESIDANWRNKLIWGDNRYAMAALLEKYTDKIDLIYIDPPFATGANFETTVSIGDEEFEHTKESSAIEELAYRDTWGKGLDSFLQMIYDRIILMKSLLSDMGTIFVHVDYRTNSFIRCIMDEIFGPDNYRNEVYVKRKTKNLQTQFDEVRQLNIAFDSIFVYSKNPKRRFKVPKKKNSNAINENQWNNFFNNADRPTLRYELLGIKLSKGQWRWSEERAKKAVSNFKEYNDKYSNDMSLIKYWEKTGSTQEFIKRDEGSSRCYYWISPKDEINVDTNWGDFYAYDNSPESYPTQKSEKLLERIIKYYSRQGDIVADFFVGGGTTAIVAEKLGRRWISCDLSRFSIHKTRKALLDIEKCKPFEILNIGKYERQYWQRHIFNKKSKEQTLAEYIAFILQLYKATPIPGSAYIHGEKNKELVHVGSVESPVTLQDIQKALDETLRMKQKILTILGWEWEMGLHDVIEQEAKKAGIKLKLLNIPREVMDKRATDAGEIAFFELAYLETVVEKDKQGFGYLIKLKDFVIPNLDLIPKEIRDKIKKWSDYIDYWSVDWNYQGDTFHNMWQAYRTKKDRKLVLESDPYEYSKKGDYQIMVKVIDIFGNDTTHLIYHKVK